MFGVSYFGYVWIELDSSMNGIDRANLGRTQTPLARYIGRKAFANGACLEKCGRVANGG